MTGIMGPCVRRDDVVRSQLSLHRTIHHPGRAELIGAHAESPGEERLAERHSDGAAFGQRLEAALGIGGILDLFTGNFEQGIKRILYGIVSLIGGVIIGAIDLVAKASDALLGTSFGKSVEGWRKGFDETLKSGFGLEAHKFAEGSEEAQLEKDRQTKESRDFLSIVPPAAAFEAAPDGGMSPADGMGFTPAALAEAISSSNAKAPPAKSTTNVSVKIDSRELRAFIAADERADADSGGASGIPVSDY